MSGLSTKRLLTGQLSSSGSSVTSDFDRDSSPSPLSMLDTEEPHHYANPQELKKDVQVELDKIDGRKKRNLLYEALPVSEKTQPNGFHPRKNSLEHPAVYLNHSKHNDRLYRFLFVMIFLMSFGAFLLSILTSFGVISSCGTCKTEKINNPSSGSSVADPVDNSKIHELERNLKNLTNIVVPSLLRQVSILQAKMVNESFHGQPGPEGPVGPQGPAGAGDLSKCRYRTEATTNSYDVELPEKKSKTQTMKIQANTGYVILGASCTSFGGTEHGLFQQNINGVRNYYCICAGKAVTEAFQNTNLKCRIHIWECPSSS